MTELEARLVALGRELEVPEAPDLATAIADRIGARRVRRRRRWALVVAVALVAALGATLAIPPARSAFLRILHIGGERVEIVDELPPVTPELDLDVALGRRVTLDEARSRAAFRLLGLPGEPDRVYVSSATGTVWFLYGTPQRVRLLLAQTPGSLDRAFVFKKLASAGTRVEPVDVGGAQGVFLSGQPHLVMLIDRHGNRVEDSVRLARDVLVFERSGVAYRLEGNLTREQAVRIALKLR